MRALKLVDVYCSCGDKTQMSRHAANTMRVKWRCTKCKNKSETLMDFATERHSTASKDHINKTKVPSFIRLYTRIKEKCGSNLAACEYLGVSDSTINRMKNEHILSATIARKIYNAYKEAAS